MRLTKQMEFNGGADGKDRVIFSKAQQRKANMQKREIKNLTAG